MTDKVRVCRTRKRINRGKKLLKYVIEIKGKKDNSIRERQMEGQCEEYVTERDINVREYKHETRKNIDTSKRLQRSQSACGKMPLVRHKNSGCIRQLAPETKLIQYVDPAIFHLPSITRLGTRISFDLYHHEQFSSSSSVVCRD